MNPAIARLIQNIRRERWYHGICYLTDQPSGVLAEAKRLRFVKMGFDEDLIVTKHGLNEYKKFKESR